MVAAIFGAALRTATGIDTTRSAKAMPFTSVILIATPAWKLEACGTE
jgi:hypothetical protein